MCGEKENEEASHQIESALFSTLLLPYLLLLMLLLLASPSSPSAERARRERRLARRIRKKVSSGRAVKREKKSGGIPVFNFSSQRRKERE